MKQAFSCEVVTAFNTLSGHPTQLSIKPLSNIKTFQEAVAIVLGRLENKDLTAARITIDRFDRPDGVQIA